MLRENKGDVSICMYSIYVAWTTVVFCNSNKVKIKTKTVLVLLHVFNEIRKKSNIVPTVIARGNPFCDKIILQIDFSIMAFKNRKLSRWKVAFAKKKIFLKWLTENKCATNWMKEVKNTCGNILCIEWCLFSNSKPNPLKRKFQRSYFWYCKRHNTKVLIYLWQRSAFANYSNFSRIILISVRRKVFSQSRNLLKVLILLKIVSYNTLVRLVFFEAFLFY